MNKRVVISFSNNRGRYYEGMKRLEESLKGRFNGEFIGFTDEESIGAPLHTNNHYSFKIYGFAHALRKGFTSIMWLDASVYAVGNIDHLFDEIEEKGYIMQEAGHMCGTWASDETLKYFGIDRYDAMGMPMYGNAGFLGLDFTQKIGKTFFYSWSIAMLSGLFMQDWNNTDNHLSADERCKGERQDMTSGSIIANIMNLSFKKGDEILEYATEEMPLKNETIVLRAAGM